MNIREQQIVPIGMISDDNFIMPTCVAVTSMICNKDPKSFYVIHILMAECSEESKRKLEELDKLSGECEIKLIEVGLERYKGFKQLAHISIACLLKFDLCDLIPDYDKILYLDGDIIVRKDLWELYSIDVEGKYAAAVKELACIKNDTGNINAGIMLFNAKRIREEKLSEICYQTRKELGDRASMDQQTFNIVTGKDYKYISIKYNCILGYLTEAEGGSNYSIEQINALYGTDYRDLMDVEKKAIIWHFATGNKPWKYTFNRSAKEWYNYYKKSPFQDVPFALKGRWSYRIDMFIKAWKTAGIKGILDRVENKLRRMLRLKKNLQKWE